MKREKRDQKWKNFITVLSEISKIHIGGEDKQMNLLIDEPPIQVLPSLAVLIGLNEAIVFQQAHYWLGKTHFEFDGRKWFYRSYKRWKEEFPFWSSATIRRTINNLEKQKLLISTSKYNKLPMDKTKWYTIDYENFSKLISRTNEQSICSKCTNEQLKLSKGTDQNEQTNNQRIIKRIKKENYINNKGVANGVGEEATENIEISIQNLVFETMETIESLSAKKGNQEEIDFEKERRKILEKIGRI